jgi:thiol-disulfide isomerase/thioredoxin
MLKKTLSITGYLLTLIILGLAVRHFAINPMINNPAINSAPLFAASLTDSQGVKQNLNQYRGKIIVLNFWATWCPPCREEMPELSQLQQEYKNKNVMVLGIAEDELAAVRTFLQSYPVTYPTFIADNENIDLSTNLGNNKGVLPYTVIIGEDGTVIDTFFGRITKPLLEKSIQNLLPH